MINKLLEKSNGQAFKLNLEKLKYNIYLVIRKMYINLLVILKASSLEKIIRTILGKAQPIIC